MFRIDLHTHSVASKDGGINPEQYADLLKNEILDCIAITDHDRIDFAKGMQKALGSERIIVGQEVTTRDGDILGLYLNKVIPAGLSATEAADEIHRQGGLVCIPHPFETVRRGITREVLEALINNVDMIEGHNGRAVFQNYGPEAHEWAKKFRKPAVANSDAHGKKGVGKTYTVLHKQPGTPAELLYELKSAQLVAARPPLRTLTYPFFNTLKKRLRGQH